MRDRVLCRLPRACPRSVAFALVAIVAGPCACAAEPLPTVASINLCADQHVLTLADPEQILTVSWLAADAEESLFAAQAREYRLNFGSAEELLALDPDVVIAGTYTSPFTRAMLRRLGRRVVELAPESSVADIERNVRLVAAALDQDVRGEHVVAALHAELETLAAQRTTESPVAVIVRPGGFTFGADTIANEMLRVAGIRNLAAEQAFDRWGSLSMEALVRSAPDLLVLVGYRGEQPSLANAAFAHPALARLGATHRTTPIPARYWSCGVPRTLESAAMLQSAVDP